MKRQGYELDPELKALLEPGKIQRKLPPEVRERALARARAVVAGDVAGDVVPPAQLAGAPPLRLARGPRLLRIALVAPIVVAAAAAIAARHSRSAHVSQLASPDIEIVQPAPSAPAVARGGAPASEPPTTASLAKPLRPTGPRHRNDPFTAELDLLERAHAAYTRAELPVALTLIAEHARRFPSSHLAEQREALRVRSLAGAGRVDEAHRAAAAFALRFPRSVLLPRIEGGSGSSEP